MQFGRLFAVVMVVTVCGGLFGGVVGGLIGYAIPTTFDAFFMTQGASTKTDAQYRVEHDHRAASSSERAVQVGVNPESKVLAGASLGGAWGLILGAIIGLVLGTVDQILIALNRLLEFRRQGQPADDAGMPTRRAI